jgi:hypothetical protein
MRTDPDDAERPTGIHGPEGNRIMEGLQFGLQFTVVR